MKIKERLKNIFETASKRTYVYGGLAISSGLGAASAYIINGDMDLRKAVVFAGISSLCTAFSYAVDRANKQADDEMNAAFDFIDQGIKDLNQDISKMDRNLNQRINSLSQEDYAEGEIIDIDHEDVTEQHNRLNP
ncbi:MAG: hypothetical protein KDJ35_07045 [Alphaproteobacteria bacterium]|nr:hypothetical protein [Alphaproteobacteria bacterium]